MFSPLRGKKRNTIRAYGSEIAYTAVRSHVVVLYIRVPPNTMIVRSEVLLHVLSGPLVSFEEGFDSRQL